MDSISGVALSLEEYNPLLLWLVRQEMHLLKFKKDLYDSDYPEHARDLSDSEFWRMACNSIIERLSDPPESNGDEKW